MEAGPEGLAADEPTPAVQASDRARSRTTSSLGGLGYQRAPAWLEDLVTGAHTAMRQAVCKRTAGGASPESRQSSWGLRAAVSHSRSHRGPPASAGLGGARAVGRDSGGWCRQTRIPGGESPVKSLVTVLAPGFAGSKSCCSHLQDRSLGTELSSSVDLTLATVFTGHLPALLVSGGGD